MIWRFEHVGKHGRRQLSLRVPDDSRAGMMLLLTPAQVRRLRRLCCGVRNCDCNEPQLWSMQFNLNIDGGATGKGYRRSSSPRALVLPEQGGEYRYCRPY